MRFLVASLFIVLLCTNLLAQDTPIGTIGFYNLENLFDTEDDPEINDEEYLPTGEREWTEERYQSKLENMSRVIADMAFGPDIVGLCEVENRKVIEDLIQTDHLKLKRYQIVHFNSPDARGIDVALIYKQGRFTPFDVRSIRFKDPADKDFRTRDILWVKGLFNGDTLHVAVNHWPSRRGGKEDKRLIAAEILRKAVDSVQNINPEAKIVLMGDFNDDPSNKSVKKVLMADNKEKKLENGMLYNASGDTFKDGLGTLFYRGAWNLFDQIIISQSLLKGQATNYYYIPNSFKVFAGEYMRETKGQNQGAPFRTFSYGVYQNGFSDHYPSIIFIGTK
ncbi:MAG: endonuclease/exonuclease/phosphatase family protein [Fulvivirga sp.]|uniref:endonuclease/exonuclease/phosphatase family protein n=1 Tax=Fulvivirga sp. TaxID=1931237 RepID=UPI0032EBEF82